MARRARADDEDGGIDRSAHADYPRRRGHDSLARLVCTSVAAKLKIIMKTSLGKFPLAIVALALSFSLHLPTVLAGPAVTSIAGGFQHSLFSKSDGSLWVMGDNGYGELGIGFTPAKT